MADGEFFEVFVDTPLEDRIKLAPKGLYANAEAGKLKNFTEVDAPAKLSKRQRLKSPANSNAPATYFVSMNILGSFCQNDFVYAY